NRAHPIAGLAGWRPGAEVKYGGSVMFLLRFVARTERRERLAVVEPGAVRGVVQRQRPENRGRDFWRQIERVGFIALERRTGAVGKPDEVISANAGRLRQHARADGVVVREERCAIVEGAIFRGNAGPRQIKRIA